MCYRLISLTIAMFITAGIFSLMQTLIPSEPVMVEKTVASFVNITPSNPVNTDPMEAVKTVKAMPVMPSSLELAASEVVLPVSTDMLITPSASDVTFSATPVQNSLESIAAFDVAIVSTESTLVNSQVDGEEVVPVSTRRPNIPDIAVEHQINGWVMLAFTVTPDGHVSKVSILDAQPRGIFEADAVKTIKGWRYSPFKGKSVRLSQRIDFDWTLHRYNMDY